MSDRDKRKSPVLQHCPQIVLRRSAGLGKSLCNMGLAEKPGDDDDDDHHHHMIMMMMMVIIII